MGDVSGAELEAVRRELNPRQIPPELRSQMADSNSSNRQIKSHENLNSREGDRLTSLMPEVRRTPKRKDYSDQAIFRSSSSSSSTPVIARGRVYLSTDEGDVPYNPSAFMNVQDEPKRKAPRPATPPAPKGKSVPELKATPAYPPSTSTALTIPEVPPAPTHPAQPMQTSWHSSYYQPVQSTTNWGVPAAPPPAHPAPMAPIPAAPVPIPKPPSEPPSSSWSCWTQVDPSENLTNEEKKDREWAACFAERDYEDQKNEKPPLPFSWNCSLWLCTIKVFTFHIFQSKS